MASSFQNGALVLSQSIRKAQLSSAAARWADVVATGPSVRTMELDDRVLFNPEDRYEVEVGGSDYIILRERDIHAVAAERLDASHTGLYL